MINDVPTRFAVSRHAILRRRGFTLVELLVAIALTLMLIAILLPALKRTIEAGRQVTCLNHLRQIAQATLSYCADNDGVFPSGAAIGYMGSDQPRTTDWIYWKPGYPAPFNDTTKSAVGRYIGTSARIVFRCPSDEVEVRPAHAYSNLIYPYSYSMNAWIAQNQTLNLNWVHLHDVRDPSEIILLVDEDVQSIDDGSWLPALGNLHNQISNRHDVNRDAPDASNSNDFEPTTRGNVTFCDGHGEFVSREFSWTKEHYQPTNHPLPSGY